MRPELNLLDLLDPKKTTSPITRLPQLPVDSCSAFSAKSRAPTCSTKSSGSPENIFVSPPAPSPKPVREKPPAHSKPRPGDWVCLVCGNHNYSFRESCNRCQKQTRACNLQQSLRILDNPALKSDLMQDPTMAKRLEFNFCYSLRTAKSEDKALNANVVRGMGYHAPVAFGMVGNGSFPDFYYGHKTPPFAQSSLAPPFAMGHLSKPHRSFPGPTDPISEFCGYGGVSEVSPLLSLNPEQRFPSFKKGGIKSDICHDKSISQVGPLQDMQQNLVEKFKRMNLIPGARNWAAKTGGSSQNNKPASKGSPRGANRDKENQGPARRAKKKLRLKPKRRGKIKYKAVEFPRPAQANGAETHPQPKAPGSEGQRIKSVEGGSQGGWAPGELPEEISGAQSSPKKMSLSSIFQSKLLFDFETPKKTRTDCFLQEGSVAQDSDFKLEKGFSRHKRKILRLFSQSDEEQSEDEEAPDGTYLEKVLSQSEFSESIHQTFARSGPSR